MKITPVIVQQRGFQLDKSLIDRPVDQMNSQPGNYGPNHNPFHQDLGQPHWSRHIAEGFVALCH